MATYFAAAGAGLSMSRLADAVKRGLSISLVTLARVWRA
jgi:hypothetical protein